MSDRDLTYQDLIEIVDLIKSSSQFAEFRLKVGDIEVEMRRGSGPSQGSLRTAEDGIVDAAAPRSPADGVARRRVAQDHPDGAILIKSPMVGTFYRAPGPGAKAFVEVGSKVEADTVTCIIEVMKLMNSIPAGHEGVITRILVEDAEAVEYGQDLMVIEPGRIA